MDWYWRRGSVAADGGPLGAAPAEPIEAPVHDYHQRGLVAFVATEAPHRNACWQRFLPTGPVARPLRSMTMVMRNCMTASARSCGRCRKPRRSACWDAPQAQFERELSAAFEGELGGFTLQSQRAAFRCAGNWRSGRSRAGCCWSAMPPT